MRQKLLSLLLLIALLMMPACTAQTTPTDAPVAPSASTVIITSVPPTSIPEPRTITVFAATALTESYTEIGSLFEERYPGSSVLFNFANSQHLSEQLNQGAKADVFASASKKFIDLAETSNRVTKFEAKTFAYNRLVIIFPVNNPGRVTRLNDLANTGLSLVLADQATPIGQYSMDFLDKANQDDSLGSSYKEDVLRNVVSYEDSVKAVVTKVALGEADAGIVYVTDITKEVANKVDILEIPDSLNSIASFPIAAITDSKNPDLAKAFVDLVLSPDGQAVFAKYAFTPAVTGATSTTSGFMVTDAMGRAIRFEKSPQKIVLVGKALFMVADAVYLFPEAGKRVIALGSTQQGSSSFIPMIDSTFADKITLDSSAGVEQIAAAQPDCVIMKSTNASTLGKALEAVKIPVVYLDFETPEQYPRDLKTLGQLFENPDQANKLIEYYKTKTSGVTEILSGLTDDQKPRTLILYYNEKDGAVAFNVPPMAWMQTLLVTNAGGLPVWEDANPGSGWTKVSLEQVAAWNPDVIFVVAYFNPVNDIVAQLKADSKWKSLEAVKNNKIYGFATDVYSWDQPDTRWILGLNWVAGKLHPDLFPGLDMAKQAQVFYQDLYGMDDASFQKNIVPLFTGDIQ